MNAKQGDIVQLKILWGKDDYKVYGRVFAIDSRQQGYYIMFNQKEKDMRLDTFHISKLLKHLRDQPNNKYVKEAIHNTKQYEHYGVDNLSYIFLYQKCCNVEVIPYNSYPFMDQAEQTDNNLYTKQELFFVMEFGPPQYLPHRRHY